MRSVAELKVLARKFEPADIGTIRLSRDAKLGASLEYLWQQWHDADWMHFKGTADTAKTPPEASSSRPGSGGSRGWPRSRRLPRAMP